MIYIVPMILIHGAVALFLTFSTFDKRLERSIVRMNGAYLVVGILSVLIFVFISIYGFIKNDTGLGIFMLVLSVLSSSLNVAFVNCRIFYDNSGFTVRNFFGRKCTVLYSEITDIEIGIDVIISSGEKRVKIADYTVGRQAFFDVLMPNVEHILNQSMKNNIVPLKVKNFRDSVHRPGEKLFGIAILILLGVGFAVMAIALSQLWMWTFVALIWLIVFLMYYAPKRSHSSKGWRAIAKLMIRPEELKFALNMSELETSVKEHFASDEVDIEGFEQRADRVLVIVTVRYTQPNRLYVLIAEQGCDGKYFIHPSNVKYLSDVADNLNYIDDLENIKEYIGWD